MATLKINDINKNFGKTEVLKGINLDIADGDFLVLLGPSGCGKSTLLNTIAGLETSNSGEILIDDYKVNDMEPSDRDIALVFQSYALYPAMTVRKNVTFGFLTKALPIATLCLCPPDNCEGFLSNKVSIFNKFETFVSASSIFSLEVFLCSSPKVTFFLTVIAGYRA